MILFPRALYPSVCAATLFSFLVASADAQTTGIKIVIQEGQGAINNIKERRAKEPVVQVLHEDGEPVVGATVTFLLPDTGASGSTLDRLYDRSALRQIHFPMARTRGQRDRRVGRRPVAPNRSAHSYRNSRLRRTV